MVCFVFKPWCDKNSWKLQKPNGKIMANQIYILGLLSTLTFIRSVTHHFIQMVSQSVFMQPLCRRQRAQICLNICLKTVTPLPLILGKYNTICPKIHDHKFGPNMTKYYQILPNMNKFLPRLMSTISFYKAKNQQ